MVDLDLLEARLKAEATVFLSRNRRDRRRRYVIFDIEYHYDREGQRRADRHAACPRGAAGNDNVEPAFEVRWPFHRIGCIAAMALCVLLNGTIKVEALDTWSRPEMTEAEIVQAFAAFVAAQGEAVPVTWGGEFKDLPALLAVAMREGVVLPPMIADPHWKHGRIDLCELLRAKAKPVHLNEYAHAQGLPGKLMAPWELGQAAERGRWTAIREHCECDVTVTAMLLTRSLLATGELKGERTVLDSLIVDAVARLRPYRPQLLKAIGDFVTPCLDLAA